MFLIMIFTNKNCDIDSYFTLFIYHLQQYRIYSQKSYLDSQDLLQYTVHSSLLLWPPLITTKAKKGANIMVVVQTSGTLVLL